MNGRRNGDKMLLTLCMEWKRLRVFYLLAYLAVNLIKMRGKQSAASCEVGIIFTTIYLALIWGAKKSYKLEWCVESRGNPRRTVRSFSASGAKFQISVAPFSALMALVHSSGAANDSAVSVVRNSGRTAPYTSQTSTRSGSTLDLPSLNCP